MRKKKIDSGISFQSGCGRTEACFHCYCNWKQRWMENVMKILFGDRFVSTGSPIVSSLFFLLSYFVTVDGLSISFLCFIVIKFSCFLFFIFSRFFHILIVLTQFSAFFVSVCVLYVEEQAAGFWWISFEHSVGLHLLCDMFYLFSHHVFCCCLYQWLSASFTV